MKEAVLRDGFFNVKLYLNLGVNFEITEIG